ncbi:VPLPA-CTERM sorting domain-containing protein [Roseovarius sp. D22-M7]|uniref:VPLPA-CTERM sorting domain-containing protein n=1 Tax=Roseovarius sp. D22-M7 TaxID=3127116 RepID=UPI0030101DFF
MRKTVTVDETGPTDATLDTFFLIDTSGSMGGVIGAAKLAADDIFTELRTTFGSDVAGGVGAYSENAGLPGDTCVGFCVGGTITPPGSVLNRDITTVESDVTNAIGDITLSNPDGGGDFPENAIDAIKLVSDNASWRTGSNRFLFTFSDASVKGLDFTSTDAISALQAESINLVALSFSGASHSGSMASTFGSDVDLTTFLSGTSAADIVADISAGISAGFEEYSTVTVGDLGGGDPEIGVSVTCVSADIGICIGADAEGEYDRSETRNFEFDVTFTRNADGDTVFPTFALLDGGIVAREIDTFDSTTAPIPLPAAGWMMVAGLGALGALRRRRRAAKA